MTRRASSRPMSICQRARALLSNRGIYVPDPPNRKVILTAIGRYEGTSTPGIVSIEYMDRIITAFVEKHELIEGRAPAPVSVYSWPVLKLSREMRAAMSRCDPKRLPK